MLSNTPGFKVMLLAAAVVAVSACGRSENAGTDTTGAATSDTAGMGAMPATNAALTDANIFAVLDEANVADSSHGAIASTKGTSSAVREYGRQMMRDHHTLRAQGQALAKQLNITPTPPAGDTIPAHAQRVADMLGTTAKGNDFDKAYIDHEVEMHKSVLDIATRAMNAAQSTELKNMIQKAAPAIQAHLDKAQSIQKTMK
jgi:putative membrane protein